MTTKPATPLPWKITETIATGNTIKLYMVESLDTLWCCQWDIYSGRIVSIRNNRTDKCLSKFSKKFNSIANFIANSRAKGQ